MSSSGFLFARFLYVLNILRYVISLSFDIPLCFDSHGLSIDALFSQLFICTYPLAYSLSVCLTVSWIYPRLSSIP